LGSERKRQMLLRRKTEPGNGRRERVVTLLEPREAQSMKYERTGVVDSDTIRRVPLGAANAADLNPYEAVENPLGQAVGERNGSRGLALSLLQSERKLSGVDPGRG